MLVAVFNASLWHDDVEAEGQDETRAAMAGISRSR